VKLKVNVEPMGTVRMTRGRIKLIQSGRYDPNDKHTKAVIAYLNYKEVIGWTAKNNAPREPYKGAIEASMTFYMPIPQSWSQKKQEAHKGDNVPHISKPDIDNLEKGLYDSLNKIIFKDDGQIYKVKEKAKYYSEFPRIEFEITEVAG
jgi:Holliday junction resolvase RusA-like endonuclease